ncbi:hypothetical protein ECPA4_1860, partial [Escherichia coli PA4]
MKNIAAQ